MAQKPKRTSTEMRPMLTPQQRAEIARRKQNTPEYRVVERQLSENHQWHCSPGHQLLILQRGDLIMEYPHGWTVVPTHVGVKLHDEPYPYDTMQYEVSALRIPVMDMERLPDKVNPLVGICESLRKDGILRTPEQSEVYEVPGVKLRYLEYDRPDPDNGRPTTWRHCYCYPVGRVLPYSILGLITWGCYTDVKDEALEVWHHSLQTLIMGEQIADPNRGPQRH